MKGSKVINSFLQTATVFARPLGNNTHYLRGRWTHAMVVGESGTLRGFRPVDHPTSQFGDIQPTIWANYGIWQLTGESGTPENWELRFGTLSNQDIQIPGVTNLLVTLEGYGTREMVWDGANSRYNYEADPGTESIHDFLGVNLGKTLGVKIGVATPA